MMHFYNKVVSIHVRYLFIGKNEMTCLLNFTGYTSDAGHHRLEYKHGGCGSHAGKEV